MRTDFSADQSPNSFRTFSWKHSLNKIYRKLQFNKYKHILYNNTSVWLYLIVSYSFRSKQKSISFITTTHLLSTYFIRPTTISPYKLLIMLPKQRQGIGSTKMTRITSYHTINSKYILYNKIIYCIIPSKKKVDITIREFDVKLRSYCLQCKSS